MGYCGSRYKCIDMNNKGNLNQAIWLGISSLSSMLVSIVSAAILARFFDKAEYGTYKQIIFVYTTLLTIFQAGLPSVFSFFLPKYSHESGKYIVNRINRLLFILGLLLSATLFLSSSYIADFLGNPELASGLKLFSPFPFFTLPTLGLEGIYIVNKNTKFVAIYNTVTRLLMLLCIVLPVIFINNTYQTAVLGWGAASIFAFVLACIFKTRPYRDVSNPSIVPNLMSSVLKYSLPIMGSSCILLFYNSINQLLISRYFGVEAFADFSNGFVPLPFVAIIINPIRQLLVPMFSKAQSEGKLREPIAFLNKSIIEISLVMVPLIAFCYLFAEDIMLFLYGDLYVSSAIFFIANLTFNLSEIFPMQAVLSGLGKTKLLMFFDIVYTILLFLVDITLIILGVADPVVIAFVFIIVQILLRGVTPYIYLLTTNRISIVEKTVILNILKMVAHAFVCAILTHWCVSFLLPSIHGFWKLTIAITVYYLQLEATGRLFHTDYLSFIKRVIIRK